jgi:hypothetical protein
MTYESPEIRDYGTMVELTAAVGAGTVEDGTNKFHDNASQPR